MNDFSLTLIIVIAISKIITGVDSLTLGDVNFSSR